ncbi:MAG TPA: hypothetical protein VFI23_12255 [Rhizomicrobium sp.]|nr:hypothetical protein [Rhizomicrobium sp.]
MRAAGTDLRNNAHAHRRNIVRAACKIAPGRGNIVSFARDTRDIGVGVADKRDGACAASV